MLPNEAGAVPAGDTEGVTVRFGNIYMASQEPNSDTIEQLTQSAYPAFSLLAGMQLDVFTHLKDRPLTTDATSASLGVKSEKLRPLLYALVAAGLLVANGEFFSNTP